MDMLSNETQARAAWSQQPGHGARLAPTPLAPARRRRSQAWRGFLPAPLPDSAPAPDAPPRPTRWPPPRRPAPPEVLATLPAHSLAARLLAAGVVDAPLGLERLPRRPVPRRKGRARWLWGALVGLLAVAALAASGGALSSGAPPAAEGATASSQVASAPPASELRVSVRPVETNYTVMPGDTLERIARRFGTTVEAIAGMNNLRDYNRLRAGEKLIIP